MARPTKALSEQKSRRTTEVQENKQEIENELKKLDPLPNEPPEYLTERAKQEYKEIYPLIMQLPVAKLDLSQLSAYCQAYADYQEATIELAKGEVVTFTERGSKVSPWHRVKIDSFGTMNSIAPKLGLTIDSRMKIISPELKEKKQDAFEDFLNDD